MSIKRQFVVIVCFLMLAQEGTSCKAAETVINNNHFTLGDWCIEQGLRVCRVRLSPRDNMPKDTVDTR